jgi:hypothetical protein
MYAEVNHARWCWGWGGFGARHSSYIFPNPVEPNARDDAGGGVLRCEASDPRPQ